MLTASHSVGSTGFPRFSNLSLEVQGRVNNPAGRGWRFFARPVKTCRAEGPRRSVCPHVIHSLRALSVGDRRWQRAGRGFGAASGMAPTDDILEHASMWGAQVRLPCDANDDVIRDAIETVGSPRPGAPPVSAVSRVGQGGAQGVRRLRRAGRRRERGGGEDQAEIRPEVVTELARGHRQGLRLLRHPRNAVLHLLQDRRQVRHDIQGLSLCCVLSCIVPLVHPSGASPLTVKSCDRWGCRPQWNGGHHRHHSRARGDARVEPSPRRIMKAGTGEVACFSSVSGPAVPRGRAPP